MIIMNRIRKNKYYKRFQMITHLPFFRQYLQWSYSQGIKDGEKLGKKIDITKNNFSCLLCGASGEITAEEFIKYVLGQNKKAKITIIDMGDEQVTAIQKLVKDKYTNYTIHVKQANALH